MVTDLQVTAKVLANILPPLGSLGAWLRQWVIETRAGQLRRLGGLAELDPRAIDPRFIRSLLIRRG